MARALELTVVLGLVGPSLSEMATTTTPYLGNVSVTSSVNETYGAGKVIKSSGLLVIHMVCMSLAWIVLASIGIIMARHYRDFMAKNTACGRPIWYQVHRVCMVLVAMLTIGGVAAVFAMQDSFLSLEGGALSKAHPPLGIVVLCLVAINPFIAFFRPIPEAPGRQLFDWLHWLIGQTAYCVAILNIFLGISIPRARHLAPTWLLWVMAAFVLVHIITEIALMAQRKYLAGYNKEEEGPILMPPAPDGSKLDIPIPPTRGTLFRKYVIIIYVLLACAFGTIFLLTVTTSLL